MKPASPRWRTRRLITLLLLLSSLVVLLSGVACYLKPQGRVARGLEWTWLGLGKEPWEALHTTMSVLLLAVGLLHLVYNRRPLLTYLRGAISRMRGGTWEFLTAVALVVLVGVGTLRDWEPFARFEVWNHAIKGWWAQDLEGVAPPGEGREGGWGRGGGEDGHGRGRGRGGHGWGRGAGEDPDPLPIIPPEEQR